MRTAGSLTDEILLAAFSLCATALVLGGCAGPEEATRVERQVRADASGLGAVTSDLGYRVELQEARVALRDLTFTIAGELHEVSLGDSLARLLLGRALAHPGHYEGGDVTGELQGRFVFDWFDEPVLGQATLLAGAYEGVNFGFARGHGDDGLDANDPLLGHTALLRGEARRDGRVLGFEAQIDAPEQRQLVGAPFQAMIGPDSNEPLGLRLLPLDPTENDTLFDGLDFEALDDDGDGQVTLAPGLEGEAEQAYNRLRRALLTHDHFDIQVTP